MGVVVVSPAVVALVCRWSSPVATEAMLGLPQLLLLRLELPDLSLDLVQLLLDSSLILGSLLTPSWRCESRDDSREERERPDGGPHRADN